MKNKKHKCALCCNKVATWKMRSSPNKIRVKYFCDDCLPKKMISGYSFEYSVNGFDLTKENKNYYVNYYDCIECLDDNTKDMTLDEEFLLTDKFGEIFLKLKSKVNPEYVKYNDIMSKFGDYLVSYCSKMFSIQTIEKHRKFYINFKKDVSKKKVLINEM